MAIRIVVADDHAVVRSGVRALVADESAMEIIGEATTGDEAMELCARLRPDVLLLDLSMPGPPAAATLRRLHAERGGVRTIVLTAYHDGSAARDLVGTGARGYVLKDDEPEAIIEAISCVVRGGTWFSPQMLSSFLRITTRSTRHPDVPELTGREQALLSLVGKGWDNKRIASALSLQVQTVRNYLSTLYAKLGVGSRAEAVVWFRDHPSLGDQPNTE